MHNIHSLAAQNTEYLITCYEDCCACIEATCLKDFENHLREKGEVTIAAFCGFAFKNPKNGEMYCTGRQQKRSGESRELVLTSILKDGRYLNAYERFTDEAERKEHFSAYRNERTIFDGTFSEGLKFKYLNFNNGQLGIPAFGDFTLAFPLNHFGADGLVFLKQNSLARPNRSQGNKHCYYFTDNNEAVDLEILTPDLSTIEHFVNLIVLKRKEDLESGTDIDYNLLVLKPFEGTLNKHRDYVEVITWQEVRIQNGVGLRAEKERFQALIDAIMNPKAILGAEIRNITELYTLINRYESENQLSTELI